ncbi:MAG: helix-turn-helix domain-containing protein [Blautia sp.]
MINGYLTTKETAEKWDITIRTVQIMCSEKKVKGAAKFGRMWAIPEDAERPDDGRVVTGQYKYWRKKQYGKN